MQFATKLKLFSDKEKIVTEFNIWKESTYFEMAIFSPPTYTPIPIYSKLVLNCLGLGTLGHLLLTIEKLFLPTILYVGTTALLIYA